LTPERWAEVSRIFKSALGLDEDARAAYLTSECGQDESLREEVNRLISSHQKASSENFIDRPPVAQSDSTDPEVKRLADGERLGPYLIIRHLGTGGMGEVYLATDTRLDRFVALKILPGEVAHDKRRMQRFEREARMVSGLNQPNILTIFEFGEVDSLHFLASEYVEGETLRDSLRTLTLRLDQILDITIQICAALEAAHEAKIVHRDIKPENVMIRRRDHIVKVLDFGLAKGPELASTTSATDSEVATQYKTVAGTILGTVSYMSPEQAQGLPVDPRTDLWSTGVVLYEMVSGQVPFKGRTSSHTIVQILENEPAPLIQTAHVAVPDELQRIVSKALVKNPDERYQSAKDLLIDLRRLKKQLDLEKELKRSTGPLVNTSSETSVTTENGSITQTAQSQGVARGILKFGVALAAIVMLIGALWGINYWRVRQNRSSTVPSVEPIEQGLTYSVTVQKYRDNKPFEPPFQLAKELLFERDYQIRLNVTSAQSGFLYILNEGPHNAGQPSEFVVLFPSPTSNNGSALVNENQQIQIPENSWIKFDKEKGTERVWLIFSPKPVSELEPVRSYASAKTHGLITDAALRDLVQQFIRKHDQKPTVEQNSERKETRVTTTKNVLVHLLIIRAFLVPRLIGRSPRNTKPFLGLLSLS
jgi:serine/threonine protein kinase